MPPRLPSWFSRFLDTGTAGLTPRQRRRVRGSNLAAVIGIFPSLVFAIGYVIVDARVYWAGASICAAAAVGYALGAMALARYRRRTAATVFLGVSLAQVTLLTIYLGRGSGIQLYFLLILSLSMILMSDQMRRWRIVALIAAPVLYATAMSLGREGWVPVTEQVGLLLNVLNFVMCGTSVAALLLFFQREAAFAEERYERELERSETLLLNILPKEIAERLKGGEEKVADRYSLVSVLFADLVGFTALSAGLVPEQVVTLLNDVFTRFDDLAEKHGLEKIKTIGDAYMVVGGLPEPSEGHVERIAQMALAMKEAVAEVSRLRKTELSLRIGIHAGPVVAGVIGRKKFNYDLWGDTVNIASRMESQGVPGEIQVTEPVARPLQDRGFQVEARGRVEVKGKGMTETFLLKAAPGSVT